MKNLITYRYIYLDFEGNDLQIVDLNICAYTYKYTGRTLQKFLKSKFYRLLSNPYDFEKTAVIVGFILDGHKIPLTDKILLYKSIAASPQSIQAYNNL